MKTLFNLLIVVFVCFFYQATAQVGIGTTNPNNSSVLEISSTDKGVLIPQVALTVGTSDPSPVTNPANSLLIYNTATVGDVTPGYYYWDGSEWKPLGESGTSAKVRRSGTETTNFTALASEDILVIAPTAAPITITLPTAGVAVGKVYTILNIGTRGASISPAQADPGGPEIQAFRACQYMFIGGSENYIQISDQ